MCLILERFFTKSPHLQRIKQIPDVSRQSHLFTKKVSPERFVRTQKPNIVSHKSLTGNRQKSGKIYKSNGINATKCQQLPQILVARACVYTYKTPKPFTCNS